MNGYGPGPTPDLPARVATGVCVFGLVGLLLPFVSSPIGFSASLFSLNPGLAVFLLLLFLGITALPVMDVTRRTVRFTPWLTVPGGLGIVGSLLVLAAFSSRSGLTGLALATGMVTIGAGAIMMMLASVGLAAVGVWTVAVHSRRRHAAGLGPVGPPGAPGWGYGPPAPPPPRPPHAPPPPPGRW